MIGAALVACMLGPAVQIPATDGEAAPEPETPPATAPTETAPPEPAPDEPAPDEPASDEPTAPEPRPPADEFASVEPVVATRAPAPTPAESDPAPPTPSEAEDKPARPRFPRLVLAVGPSVGPHAIGNQECRDSDQTCVTAGGFFGMGLSSEVRVSAYKALYAHARGLLVGNVSPQQRDPLYRGLWGLGVGVGAYGRRIFARAEYLFVDTFGKSTFTPPFHTAETGSDVWGHHAGLLSFGFRQPFGKRWAAELWGGPMIGPRSRREVPPAPAQTRVLPTFLVGINLTYDALQ